MLAILKEYRIGRFVIMHSGVPQVQPFPFDIFHSGAPIRRKSCIYMNNPQKLLLAAMACFASLPSMNGAFSQCKADLIEGEIMAVAYSGFREGQHPDRGEGEINPSKEETLEDLNILVEHGFKLIRLYDSRNNSEMVLR